jgi:ABC-type Fe3+/spermidine/putrescine transport system ATPase subunit
VANFLGINAFKGKAARAEGGLLAVESSGVRLVSASGGEFDGKEVVATLKPEDIKLSNSPDSDMPNCIEATIMEMAQMRSTAQVTVDLGFTLKARLPLSAVKASGLSIGEKVYVCFAAEALNVFVDKS